MFRNTAWTLCGIACCLMFGNGAIFAQVPSSDSQPTTKARQLEFFETRIRPALAVHCYECHNSSGTAEGGLALDHRDVLLKGGDNGKVLIPGQPDNSRLLKSIRHELPGLEMPEDGAKLEDTLLADFEQWIREGAFDPRDAPPTAAELTKASSWELKFKERQDWWCFQPIAPQPVPDQVPPSWQQNPIDAFVIHRLTQNKLAPAESAEPHQLIRRLYFAITGLPPTPDETAGWMKKIEQSTPIRRTQVIEELVDELLANPHFGERWARHWMDWIRYAESHGSEGDPEIKNVWHYRDYLIRALNQDVPIDQLIREHVAGDLLEAPRLNDSLGINESIIGSAHWRMVFHGFAPTDALDEKVRFIDDQINTFTKAFLGLTVSCARCHDHKFDAISQADYYALFGILASCRPGRKAIDVPARTNIHRQRMLDLKQEIRTSLANDWTQSPGTLLDRLNNLKPEANRKTNSIAAVFWQVNESLKSEPDFATAWTKQIEKARHQIDGSKEGLKSLRNTEASIWNLTQPEDLDQWFRNGDGLGSRSTTADFAIHPTGKLALSGIYPEGVYSHLISTKHGARFTSPDVQIGQNMEIWCQTLGDSGATIRYVVQDYPRNGTVYPVTSLTTRWQWRKFDVSYWAGDQIHLELATAADAPLLAKPQPRSWFGIRQAIIAPKGKFQPTNAPLALPALLLNSERATPRSRQELARQTVALIQKSIEAWSKLQATDEQNILLNECLQLGLLENRVSSLPTSQALIEEYRQLEADIAVATRVPSLDESQGSDFPLLVRGDHKQPADKVRRRFLQAIDDRPFDSDSNTNSSGRRMLAEKLLSPQNPLTQRVIVNRIWHHLFGRGIVATPDNFGKLGARPSHPRLLDWLATRLKQDKWSLKATIKRMVMSNTWQQSSTVSATSQSLDPQNELWSHANVRRLEAEAIRDQMLFVSNRLDRKFYGPPVNSNSNRKSIYIQVRRNALDPFLRTFDFPEPFSTVGRRDVTNVPAQSLTLLNDPRIMEMAKAWAKSILKQFPDSHQLEARTNQMFLSAFARPVTPSEITQVSGFIRETRQWLEEAQRQRTALRKTRSKLQQQLDAIRNPVLKELRQSTATPRKSTPPIAEWDFSISNRDQIGSAHGQLLNGAKRVNGSIELAAGGYFKTAPIAQEITTKTLEAWVQLDTLNQRGGAVMSIQTPDGSSFDAIVFGEQEPGRWLAGSEFFRRTESFGGPAEQTATQSPVHLAWVYHADGEITAYRDGKVYGRTYRSNGPRKFAAKHSVVTLGLRHLPATPGRFLSGNIFKARLYDRALTADEVAANSGLITEKDVFNALSPEDQRRLQELQAELKRLDEALDESRGLPQATDAAVWTELARSLFTFKEFIYVR